MKDKFYTLLEISKEDLHASELLYKNSMYPQSLFYFQQATEKLIKYIGLKENIIEKNDLQNKISHKTTIIFKRVMDKYRRQFHDKVDFDIDNTFIEINNFINDSPISEVVSALLKQIRDAIENTPTFPFDLNAIETLEDFCKILEHFTPDDPNIEILRKIKTDNIRPIIDKKIKEFKTQLPNYTQGIWILFVINSLSEKLVSSVRYPDLNDMINPSQKYNQENPLIKAFPIFHKAIHFCSEVIQ